MNRAISAEEMRSAPKKGAKFSKSFPSKRFVKLGRKTSEGSLHSSSSTSPSAETDVTFRQPSKSRLHRHANRLSGVFFPASASSSGSLALGSGVRWSYRDKKRCNDLESDNDCELSSQITAPGILKVFGGEICRGAHYKSVLASTNSSAAELVKEALDRYGLGKDEADSYVLCDTIGSISSHQWKTEGFRVVGSNEKPLLLQSLWKPREGLARRFEIQKRSWVEEQASKDRDTITAGINAQARRLQKSHSRVKSTLIEKKTDQQGHGRNRSVLDLSHVGKAKDELISCLEESLGQDSNAPSESFKEDYVQLTSAPEEESGQQDETETLCPLESGGEREAEESEREETESSDDNNTQFSIHPPRDCPYLLLLQGYSLTQDFVIYLLANPTILIGSSHGTGNESKPDIVLASPDILPKHCCLHRHSLPSPTVLRPCQGASVMRNGEVVKEEVLLAPGDVIGLGHNYLFLFKDHLSNKEETCCKLTQSSVSPAAGLMQHPNSATESKEKIMATLSPPFIISPEGHYFTLSYQPADEARIISEIVAMGDRKTEHRPPLSVAFLLCVCLQCSSAQTSDLRRLLLLTASLVQSSVWDYTKKLAAAQTEASVGVGSCQDLISGLRPLVTWLSNSLELLQFIQNDLLMILRLRAENEREEEGKGRVEQDESLAAMELHLSQVQSASEETTTVLEEVIMLCFQQCVYYITKILHPILMGLLDCNPFRESAGSPTSGGLRTPYELEQLVLVLSETGRLLSERLLHPEMSSQLMAYLFYFINASLFNSLMERGSEPGFYQWSRGVCMRANLDLLLDWAHAAGLGELALEHTLTFSTATNLLATPRKNLLQTSWASLRREYPTLSPAQLNHLLSFYSPASPCRHIWSPSVEDRAAAHDTADILEDFDEHHPLVLPDVGDEFHLRGTVTDSGLAEQLNQLQEFIKNLNNSNAIKDSVAQPFSSYMLDLSCTKHLSRKLQNTELQAAEMECSEDIRLDLDRFIIDGDTPKLESDIWKKFDIDSSPHDSTVETLEDGGLVSECLAALKVGHFKPGGSTSRGISALIEEEEEEELLESNSELFSLELRRGKRGLGLSLVDTSETSFKVEGMLVGAVIPDSPAGRCGKLRPGDQILAVNAVSLIGLDYHSGKELIQTSGDRLKLLVAPSGWTHQTMRTDC
ncbi:ras-associating and dilute domain-containing protein isoform 1-T1 [Synchiropus picturatus]